MLGARRIAGLVAALACVAGAACMQSESNYGPSSEAPDGLRANPLATAMPEFRVGLGRLPNRTGPANVAVRFNGRVAPFIAQKGQAYGTYTFAADWRGGALAMTEDPSSQDRVAIALFEGETIPFTQRGLGEVDVYA